MLYSMQFITSSRAKNYGIFFSFRQISQLQLFDFINPNKLRQTYRVYNIWYKWKESKIHLIKQDLQANLQLNFNLILLCKRKDMKVIDINEYRLFSSRIFSPQNARCNYFLIEIFLNFQTPMSSHKQKPIRCSDFVQTELMKFV